MMVFEKLYNETENEVKILRIRSRLVDVQLESLKKSCSYGIYIPRTIRLNKSTSILHHKLFLIFKIILWIYPIQLNRFS